MIFYILYILSFFNGDAFLHITFYDRMIYISMLSVIILNLIVLFYCLCFHEWNSDYYNKIQNWYKCLYISIVMEFIVCLLNYSCIIFSYSIIIVSISCFLNIVKSIAPYYFGITSHMSKFPVIFMFYCVYTIPDTIKVYPYIENEPTVIIVV